MANPQYHFVTNWKFVAHIDEVAAILEDVANLGEWWPSVYLSVDIVRSGDESGIGKRVRLLTKGFLPYTLNWCFDVTDCHSPHGFTIKADGDFEGTGVWKLQQTAEFVDVQFDWKIAATKPLLRRLSWLFKPAFSANHQWAMAKGEESLKLELLRRRGENGVPLPPPPTWPHNQDS